MTVYADILFLVNFSLDFVTLYITGRLMSLSMKTLRLTVSASLGAFFAVLALVLDIDGFLYTVSSATVCQLMCCLAYRQKGVIENISSAVLAFCVGSALGGAMTAVYSLGVGYRDSLTEEKEEGISVMVFAALLGLSLVSLGCRAAKRRVNVSVCSVKIEENGKCLTVSALTDSGSFLREPISGRSALIVRAEKLKDILPKELTDASRDAVSCISEIPQGLLSRVRLLPVKSITGEGMLLGYRAESVTLVNGRKEKYIDCYLALSPDSAGFSGCDAIVPSELL